MFICFLPDPESPPEIYLYWTGVGAWMAGTFGKHALIGDAWPLCFRPPWLHDMMLPPETRAHPDGLFFYCVTQGEELLAVVVDSPNGYPPHYAARKYGKDVENAQAQHFWDYRWLPYWRAMQVAPDLDNEV